MRREIYRAVSPLPMSRGVQGLTMQEAGRRAAVSPSSLYTYFHSKRDLALYGLSPEVLAWFCDDMKNRCAHMLAAGNVDLALREFARIGASRADFIRPSMHAAIELGYDQFWEALDRGFRDGIASLAKTLGHLLRDVSDVELAALGRAFKRTILAGVLDKDCTAADVQSQLLLLLSAAGTGAAAPKAAGTTVEFPERVPPRGAPRSSPAGFRALRARARCRMRP